MIAAAAIGATSAGTFAAAAAAAAIAAAAAAVESLAAAVASAMVDAKIVVVVGHVGGAWRLARSRSWAGPGDVGGAAFANGSKQTLDATWPILQGLQSKPLLKEGTRTLLAEVP